MVVTLMRSQIEMLRKNYDKIISTASNYITQKQTGSSPGVQNKFHGLQVIAEQLKNQLRKYEVQ